MVRIGNFSRLVVVSQTFAAIFKELASLSEAHREAEEFAHSKTHSLEEELRAAADKYSELELGEAHAVEELRVEAEEHAEFRAESMGELAELEHSYKRECEELRMFGETRAFEDNLRLTHAEAQREVSSGAAVQRREALRLANLEVELEALRWDKDRAEAQNKLLQEAIRNREHDNHVLNTRCTQLAGDLALVSQRNVELNKELQRLSRQAGPSSSSTAQAHTDSAECKQS
eukprot:TRINITY_DN15477_c0_g2_i1.p1 TRINITY_DN15477_c0_g2~~TRINITY_DN15477_c0_g2_i1.p1  ORF type:complete len:231 (+),score=70.43 TRINITY_DN15477_c0_g2_i1:94-786(+)